MNSLLVYKEELVTASRAVISGSRAARVQMDHDLKLGLLISAALYGEKRGRARVVALQPNQIELEVEFVESPPPRLNAELLIAVPRPQTVKKVLQFVSCAGFDKVHFFKSSKVDKSYLQSKSLKPLEIKEHIGIGLQQGFDCIAPEIVIHRAYSGFMKNLSAYNDALKIIAHAPKHFENSAYEDVQRRGDRKLVMAVGPESGWIDEEVLDFEKRGFKRVSLGERNYRVEVALAMLVGMLRR